MVRGWLECQPHLARGYDLEAIGNSEGRLRRVAHCSRGERGNAEIGSVVDQAAIFRAKGPVFRDGEITASAIDKSAFGLPCGGRIRTEAARGGDPARCRIEDQSATLGDQVRTEPESHFRVQYNWPAPGLNFRAREGEVEKQPYYRKYGNMGLMKTTLEIPDFLFRRAKSVAAERGIPLRQFVTEAVQEKLKTTSQERPWMKHVGKLKHLHKERRQIERRVEEAFEQIDGEIWK